MSRKPILVMILTIFLLGLLGVTFKAQKVEASGMIYIRFDGSVDPPTAPISTLDNTTYTFTDNIYDSIVIEKDDIVIYGAEYTIEGPGKYLAAAMGIKIEVENNITIKNVKIEEFGTGIFCTYHIKNMIIYGNIISNDFVGIELMSCESSTISDNVFLNDSRGIVIHNSDGNLISGNNISTDEYGILIGPIEGHSDNNVISRNNISDSFAAIDLMHNNNNSIFHNTFSNNDEGIRIIESNNNLFFHNNFINNTYQVYDLSWEYPFIEPSINVWDNGYPPGGNYWSDYNGTDSDHDGIGDSSYIIDANNQDDYPLMGMFYDFKVTSEHHVQTICNSTITDFQFNGTSISFNVSGENDTTGFCRICIPTALMNATYTVFVNGTEVSYNLLPCSNETYSYLYFNYTHSTQEIIIIPEFPSFLILPLFMTLTLLTVIICKRKHTRKSCSTLL